MVKKENQKEKETAMVAVGVVLLIAGVKHGLTNLVEQWRALMFLCLNLLLLTILLTSLHHSNSTKNKDQKNTSKPIKKTERLNVKSKKVKRKGSNATSVTTSWPLQVEELFKVEEAVFVAPDIEKTEVIVVHDDVEEVDEHQHVSKDELNARVESFILMFRQQLALDAQGKLQRRSCEN